MKRMKLKHLLQYLEAEDNPTNRIQIVTGGQDWDCADELGVDSELLNPFKEWIVMYLRCEKSNGIPIMRAYICPYL